MEAIELACRMRDHLIRGVLDFWVRHALSEPHGGYFAQLSREGAPLGDVQHLSTSARIASAFVEASRLAWSPRYLAAARRGLRYALDHFPDRERGGWFLEIESDGRIRDDTKLPRGHALLLEALAEYHAEAGDEAVGDAAWTTWRWMRERLWDGRYGGFPETADREGRPLRERKTLGTHLDYLAATLSLARAFPEEATFRREVEEVVDLLARRARDPESGALLEWFRRDWTPVIERGAPVVCYGHNFEAALLLFEAARLLERDDCARLGGDLARYGLEHGLDPRRRLCRHLGAPSGETWSPEAPWWAQAMAIGALAAGGRALGRAEWLDASRAAFDRAVETYYDPEHGGWFGVLRPDGSFESTRKGWIGLDPYHVTHGLAQAIYALEGHPPPAGRARARPSDTSLHLG